MLVDQMLIQPPMIFLPHVCLDVFKAGFQEVHQKKHDNFGACHSFKLEALAAGSLHQWKVFEETKGLCCCYEILDIILDNTY